MTSNPTAIGMETPAIPPFCSAGPVEGSKYPRIIPMAMARKIHTARNLSRNPSCLKTEGEVLAWSTGDSAGGVIVSWAGELEEGASRPASTFFAKVFIFDITLISLCSGGNNLGRRFIKTAVAG